jgi:hypothetical protein
VAPDDSSESEGSDSGENGDGMQEHADEGEDKLESDDEEIGTMTKARLIKEASIYRFLCRQGLTQFPDTRLR